MDQVERYDDMNEAKVHSLLDRLIRRHDCVLCYDRSLIDQIPYILAEQYQIADSAAARSDPVVCELFDIVDKSGKSKYELFALPMLLKATGIEMQRYSTRSEMPEADRDDFQQFEEGTADVSKDAVLKIQRDVGSNTYKGDAYNPDILRDDLLHKYLRRVSPVRRTIVERLLRSDFWSIRFKIWKYMRKIDPESPSLSIGPRWITEIRFFREVIGLTKHIGIDLHSHDESMIRVGDMHEMPFEDNTFGFLFMKNTVDKSYDIRMLVSELLRVVMPGGVIAIDGGCYFGNATVLHRTSIQRAENLLRIIKAMASVEVLVCQTVPLPPEKIPAGSPTTHYARLAIRLLNTP